MKRDIKRDREKLEDARRYNYNASTWDQTMEQGRRVKELIEEALPCYLNLCEHQQRMVEAASDLVWRVLRCCPPVSPKTCRRNARDCEKCIRDYLDTKAKEGEGK